MRRRINKVNWCCLTISWLCFSVATPTIFSAHQPGDEKEVPIKVREETIKQAKKDIEKVREQINQNCTSLEETMLTANAITDVLPYQMNTPRYNFNLYCVADGTLIWTSKSVLDPKDSDQHEDETTVTAIATKLQASRIGDQELVELITDPASIQVYYDGNTKTRPGWDLDLNRRKYATVFLSTLKDLGTNLKKREELEKTLAKEEEALEAQRLKPKPKPKSRRRVKAQDTKPT